MFAIPWKSRILAKLWARSEETMHLSSSIPSNNARYTQRQRWLRSDLIDYHSWCNMNRRYVEILEIYSLQS